MRFQHVLQRVYGEPWLITPSGWYAIHQIVMEHYKAPPASAPGPQGKRPEKGFFGELLPKMTISNGVARIPIHGTMVKGASLLEKCCGAVSHEDIHEDLDTAVAAGVKSIVLDINSPGGTVVGTPELAARVAQLGRSGIQTYAFTDYLMCSAAYFVAASCKKIFSSQSAMVGSIGTIWEFYNVAGQLSAEGIEFDIFRSGKLKAVGHPAERLTQEQKDWIQSQVNESAADFKQHVKKQRSLVGDKAMQGQVFTGKQARAEYLVDELVTHIGAVTNQASKDAGLARYFEDYPQARPTATANEPEPAAAETAEQKPDFSHLRGRDRFRAATRWQLEQKKKASEQENSDFSHLHGIEKTRAAIRAQMERNDEQVVH